MRQVMQFWLTALKKSIVVKTRHYFESRDISIYVIMGLIMKKLLESQPYL